MDYPDIFIDPMSPHPALKQLSAVGLKPLKKTGIGQYHPIGQ